MANNDIKDEIKAANVKFYEVAYTLGLTDGNFSRKLRFELPAEYKERIRAAILKLKEDADNADS